MPPTTQRKYQTAAASERAAKLVRSGMAFHRLGDLAQAEKAYRAAITAQADDFDALHLLGVVLIQAGKARSGVGFIDEALARRADAPAFNNRGNGLKALGKLDDAVASYGRAVELRPDYADAWRNRGLVLMELQRLEEAVISCERALALQPDYAEACLCRGEALASLGRLDEAATGFARAAELRPDLIQAWRQSAMTLKRLGRADEAVGAYRRLLVLQPDKSEHWINFSNLLVDLQHFEEALASYDRALTLAPQSSSAWNNRGAALFGLKRHQEALDCYDRALALDPDYADALNNRGIALSALKRPADALKSFQRAAAVRPDYRDAQVCSARALRELNRYDEALAVLDQIVAKWPDHAEGWDSRGSVLKDLKRYSESLASFDRALGVKPDFAQAQSNRGNALLAQGDHQEALADYERALQLSPDFVHAWNNRGVAQFHLGLMADALVSFSRAIELDPLNADALFHKGLCLLFYGRFEEGWSFYEHRANRSSAGAHFAARKFDRQLWNGAESLEGKTLFVHWEQGLGDTLQFCRFAGLAEQRGARVVFSVQNSLMALMKTLSPSIALIEKDRVPTEFDCYCPLLSLPRAFGVNGAAIPGAPPYLRAEPGRVAKWRARIGEHGFRIGIGWQGSRSPVDVGRSFHVSQFAAVADIPGVRLISLQKNDGVEQLRDLPKGVRIETLGDDFDASADAFLDSAAVIENLDLVISSDTALAHLAGALGRPVWLALKQAPDWRWMDEREDSPWYPTMRLFRQKSSGDWPAVFAEMAMALRNMTANASQTAPVLPAPFAPVSWGDLFERIVTKELHGADEAIDNELAQLRAIAAVACVRDDMRRLKAELMAILARQQSEEATLRDKERRSEFGADFITVARSICRHRDQMASIKSRINAALGQTAVGNFQQRNRSELGGCGETMPTGTPALHRN